MTYCRCQLLLHFGVGIAAGLFLQTTPECFKIKCGELKCLPPLEIRKDPGLCCPICSGPVTLDPRHVHFDSPYLRKTHAEAPANCEGAKCFALNCAKGQVPGYKPNSCCSTCVLEGSVHALNVHTQPATVSKVASAGLIPAEMIPKETATPLKTVACAETDQNCHVSKCCKDANLICYEKDEHWATCKATCTPGLDKHDPVEFQTPWSCNALSTAPIPCSPAGQNCHASKCCEDPSLTCYEKDDEWASCKPTCTPGVDSNDPAEFQTPWSCNVLGSQAQVAHANYVLSERGTNCENPESTVTFEEDCEEAAHELKLQYEGVVHFKSGRPSGCFHDSEAAGVFFNDQGELMEFAEITSSADIRSVDAAICYNDENAMFHDDMELE